MNRRNFVRSTALTVAAFGIGHQKLFAAIGIDPWKIKMLNKNLGIFTERGGTIVFLIGKEDIVVVDSQFPEQSKHLIDELKKKSSNPYRLLINTHHHGDHSGGNIAFKDTVQHVLAHANSKANQERVAKERKTEAQQLYPDQTYTITWSEKIGKETITLYYHGAAHTNGDSMVYFKKANAVHMGDLVFNRRHPVIDRSSGASIKNWIKVLEEGLPKFKRNTTFIFGHAGAGYEVTGSKADVLAFKDYLTNLMAFVETEIKSGKTKVEIVKAKEIPGSPEWKGEGIERAITAAYDELTTA